ncbi:OmpA family protein [Aquimarina sp. 2201CG5-10]|uniref:OmpA family protein n=1 Tax=Aquimarina callyspongiae TaxID=3098150 RepID=UPI002AB4E739|nr:OmpA family protein [Aquimarina sp. 2201CG5-10]MDY8136867.1 OmpA family protein [Aquimarina sp. 2201CG5-10]
MKTHRVIIGVVLVAFFMTGMNTVQAQFWKKVTKTAEKAAEKAILKKTKEKVSKKTDKTIEDVIEKKSGKKQEEGVENEEVFSNKENNDSTKIDQEKENSSSIFKVYSKFDFVPGEKVIAFEDFSQDEVGDLPGRWNSSNSAEIVTLSNAEGRWLQIGRGEGAFVPEFIEEFPENFTLEYDVIYDYDVSEYAFKRDLVVIFSDIENAGYELTKISPGNNGFYFSIEGGNSGGGGVEVFKYTKDRKLNMRSDKKIPQIDKSNNGRGNKMHVSIWKQKQRVRVYVDEKKVFDIPRAFERGVAVNNLRFFSQVTTDDTYYYLANIRYSVGKPDIRNKLITEGKLITYGITFDTAKTKVKSESYGTIKKIASILKENPEIKVMITGHTDSEGGKSFNQELSEKRAEAVKQIFVNQFQINSSRLMTEGKGEEEPIALENEPDTKAKNRRVEFKKI